MKKAAAKDILRTIWKEKKRFISIMMITALGVTMMTGLEAGCRDLRYSADSFFDRQKLFDISVVSTLGLTDEDVDALSNLEGVERAEGGYSEIVHTKNRELNKTAEVKTIQEEGMNLPYVKEGTLPKKGNEIAVSVNYLSDTGKQLGDRVAIEEMLKEEAVPEKEEDSGEENYLEEEEGETPNFLYTEYTITGVVVDAMDINNAEGSAAFRATPNADYTFFVLPEAVDSEVYTTVYLSLEGTGDLLCYTTEYEDRVNGLVSRIEGEIKEQREQARYDELTGEAYGKIEDAEREMKEEFDEVEGEFSDARKEISDGWKEMDKGRQELIDKEAEAAAQFAKARAEIEDGYRKLEEGEQELKEASDQLYQGNLQAAQGRAELEAKEEEAKEKLSQGEATLRARQEENAQAKADLAARVEQISAPFGTSWPTDSWNAYVAAATSVLASLLGSQGSGMSESMTAEQQAALLQAVIGQMMASHPDIVTGFEQAFGNLAANAALPDPAAFVSQVMQLAASTALLEAVEGMLNQAEATLAKEKAYAESQIAAGWAEIAKAEEELAAATDKIHTGKRELEENRKKLADAVRELAENEKKAEQEFANARKELAEGEQELIDGQKELEDNWLEYEVEKGKAEKKIAEARAEVEDLDMTQWYVQDRTSLSGYVNVKSDTLSIESLASVFTIVFFVVAILISLTTVTRMVEEERGLVGTYKALGFTDAEIRRKYVVYALAASFAGGILGDFCGFVVLPKILFLFFDVMYLLPEYFLQFDLRSGSIGIALFMVGIVGAAIWACETELKHLPAQLMRPKAPRLGSKVLLERIAPLWKRFSFLNKVTARNLFRYKKRLIMTILGISGCTALVLFGFAIKDSVQELMPLQYERVYKYDLLAATMWEDRDKLLAYLEESSEVEEYVHIQLETVKLKNVEGDTEKLQLMIFPEEAELASYVTLTNVESEAVELPDTGIYLTENAAKILGLKKEDRAHMQNLDLVQKEVQITDIVKNYLGNNIYMSREAYVKAFGEYRPNGVLANLAESCTDQIGFSKELSREDWILSAVSTQELKEGFSAAFTLINIVVYVVLVLAAGLAFVVLFTLATTNISERIRELATIKVLGFFDREVHAYVNKETLILTGIGILSGLPLGALISSMLTDILDMPSIYFAVTIYPVSYVISAAVALLFALMVQLMTNRTLDVIDPVEALKSVE